MPNLTTKQDLEDLRLYSLSLNWFKRLFFPSNLYTAIQGYDSVNPTAEQARGVYAAYNQSSGLFFWLGKLFLSGLNSFSSKESTIHFNEANHLASLSLEQNDNPNEIELNEEPDVQEEHEEDEELEEQMNDNDLDNTDHQAVALAPSSTIVSMQEETAVTSPNTSIIDKKDKKKDKSIQGSTSNVVSLLANATPPLNPFLDGSAAVAQVPPTTNNRPLRFNTPDTIEANRASQSIGAPQATLQLKDNVIPLTQAKSDAAAIPADKQATQNAAPSENGMFAKTGTEAAVNVPEAKKATKEKTSCCNMQ